MGQELAVTPIQLVMAHAALANGGTLQTPRLILRHESDSHLDSGTARQPTESRLVSRVCGEETAHWLVREPMAQVVARGTGKKARLSEYPVFGKTGTAQKLDAETGTYSHSRYIASFVCGAPVENPQVVVLVMVDEPHDGGTGFGGDVAAPTASRILKKALVHLRVPSTAVRTLPDRQ